MTIKIEGEKAYEIFLSAKSLQSFDSIRLDSFSFQCFWFSKIETICFRYLWLPLDIFGFLCYIYDIFSYLKIYTFLFQVI